MPDNVPVPESPTGTPVIPPAVFKWIALAVLLALAVLGVLMAAYPEIKGFGVAFGILSAVAGVLGIASPGLRRAAVVLLCLAPLALTGCEHVRLKPGAEAKLIQCGTDVMQSEAQAVLPDVAKALQGTAVDWQPQLDALVAKAGCAALCALAVLVANLEVGGGAGVGLIEPVGPKYPDSVLLMRGYAYQAAHPYRLE